jgi:translation initiation factor 4E
MNSSLFNDNAPTQSEHQALDKHALQYPWVFWFMHRPPGSKIVDYESNMKRIAEFSSVNIK